MNSYLVSRCTSCGDPIDEFDPRGAVDAAEEMENSHCDRCNARFHESMRNEYPHGQCPECGAAGELVVCSLMEQHLFFGHVEGVCRYWRDYAPMEANEDLLGYCEYGCHPEFSPLTVDQTFMDDLPF